MKSLLINILMALAILPASAQNRQVTLNDGWTFDGQPVRLPHTWNTDAYTVKDYRRGTGIYERRLRVTAGAVEVKRYLKIDAAFKVAKVFVNGHLAQTHQGGYSAFVTDLTPHLKAGDNLLRVEVDNNDADVPPISADFTFMGGIYRDVWLIETPPFHFDLLNGLNLTADTTAVSVSCRFDGQLSRPLAVVVRLLDADGMLLNQQRIRLKAKATAVSCRLQLARNLHLWSPEHPYLYKVEATLYAPDGKTPVDQLTRQIGVRFYHFDPERGFFLNGQPYKLKGVCRHQDQRPYGVAIDDDMHRRDFRLIKQMGANFIRLAHYPQDDAFLDECDRQGMLVWEETPIVNTIPKGETFAANCEQQLREMIRNHRHHTSIILWGYMNEILLETFWNYQGAERDSIVGRTVKLARRLERTLHDEDPSRLSTMAFHGSDDYNRVGLGDVPQTVGWNLYQGWYSGSLNDFERYLEQQHSQHPTHPIIVSEYGAGSDLRIHTMQPQPFDFSTEYQQRYAEHYLPVIEHTPYIAGGAYWNFIDFSSAVRDESMPRINNKGLVTADRKPKDVYYYFQACWSDKPVCHITTRDWPSRDALQRQMPVKVYTNQPTVELFQNGHSLGKKSVENCIATFDVSFIDGTNHLHAVAASIDDHHTVSFTTPQGEWAVNLGSLCYYQSAKSALTWQPDQPYTPGSYGYLDGEPATTTTQIQLTDDGPLYQSQRKNLSAYRFDLPRGDYEVELLSADIDRHSQQAIYLLRKDSSEVTEASVFSRITINGSQEVLGDVCLSDRPFTAERRRYVVSTSADSLVIHFQPAISLAAIKIRILK